MKSKLPKEINGFVYVKSVNTTKEYKVAIYQNNKDSKVVLKAITKKPFFNFYRYWIENEISILKYLNSVKMGRFFFPKLEFEFELDNFKGFATKFIEGKNIEKLSVSKKVEVYNFIISKLQNIPVQGKTLKLVRARGYRYYLKVSLFNFLRSVFKGNLALSLKIFVNIIYLFIEIHAESALVFSHCDLYDSNIIQSERNLFLLDYERASFTEKEVDLAYLLIRYWKDKKFVSQLINKQKPEDKKLAFFVLYLGLSDLATSSDLDKKTLLNFIEFGFNLIKRDL